MYFRHYTDALREIKKKLDIIDKDYKETQYIKKSKTELLTAFKDIQKNKKVSKQQEYIIKNMYIPPRIEEQKSLFDRIEEPINLF